MPALLGGMATVLTLTQDHSESFLWLPASDLVCSTYWKNAKGETGCTDALLLTEQK